MGLASLTRRSAQLALLESACRQQAPALIWPCRHATRSFARPTRLLRVRPDGVLLTMPDDVVIGEAPAGFPVRVVFEHQGNRYAFTASVQLPDHDAADSADCRALCLSPPLQVVPHRPRRPFRVRLSRVGAVPVRLQELCGRGQTAVLALTEITTAGFRAVGPAGLRGALAARAFFRSEFALPGEEKAIEYIVRLLARRRVRQSARAAATTWAFCPGDDPALFAEQTALIERWATARQPVRLCQVLSRTAREG